MVLNARKILTRGFVYGVGVIVTVLVMGAARLGLLDSLELALYDTRARECQFFAPPPTDRLVHIFIDDAALDAVGEWPWPRSVLGEMSDEIALAGPKAVVMNILFHDPQKARYEPGADGKYVEINDDEAFAASLKRLGCALMPVSMPPAAPKTFTPLQLALHQALRENLELNETDAAAVPKRSGIAHVKSRDVVEAFLEARRDVMYERVAAALRKQPLTREQLRALLLPGTDRNLQSPGVRLLDDQYAQVTSQLDLLRFARPVPPEVPNMLHAETITVPVLSLSQAARQTGFVDYPKSDSRLRRVPLFMEHEGRMYPHIAVSLAAMMLDADPAQIRFSDREIIIPRPGGLPVVIPVNTFESQSLHRTVPMMFDIPWFGKTDSWETMYDRVGGANLSFNVVWDACLTRRKIAHNNALADDVLRFLYATFAPEKLDGFDKHPLPPDDALNRIELCRAVLAEYGAFIQGAEETNLAEIKAPAERDAVERLAAQGRALRYVISENPKLQTQLDAQRGVLRQRLRGRAVLIGWNATGQVANEVATSLHNKCPDVVVHGVILNAIMTGRMWWRVPPWINAGAVLLMGGLTTALLGRLSPARALIWTLLLGFLYTAVNAILLFDWGNRIVSLAAPLVAIGLVWSSITVARFIAEASEHRRIRRRFQSYIDPILVNYVYEHPELARLEGQVREMTVCFTDLVGFTSFTEEFRERAVRVLGRYTGRMVPCIRRHRGLVHRFMGDGLMFSYGAPIENPNHAVDAVSTLLDMFRVMSEFNRELLAEGYPILQLRGGVSTGEVIVGDTGTDDACDYSCLGDVTNFAARLETANKAVGTRILLSARTVELIGDRFLVRPIGRLRVMGKKLAVMTYEPLAPADSATSEQKQLAAMTAEMVDHFLAARFDECVAAATRLDEEFGSSKLSKIYRDACQSHLTTPAPEFAGHILLEGK